MTRSRIDRRFEALRAEGRSAFVAYVMAGDPTIEAAGKILAGLPAAGADIIELGFPFSDPMAEGPPIQRASQRALANHMTLAGTLELVRAFRLADTETPLILMGYYNPLLTMGLDLFAQRAAEVGVDGLIIVDCPPEEADPLCDALDGHQLSLIRLATPTTDADRLKTVVRRTSGFVYYVSVAGVTGVKEADAGAVAPAVLAVRAASGLPVAVGFGIKTPQRAADVARVADAVVVGSALVEEIASVTDLSGPGAQMAVDRVLSKAAELSLAVRTAGSMLQPAMQD